MSNDINGINNAVSYSSVLPLLHSNTVFINECDIRTNTKEQNKKQTEQI